MEQEVSIIGWGLIKGLPQVVCLLVPVVINPVVPSLQPSVIHGKPRGGPRVGNESKSAVIVLHVSAAGVYEEAARRAARRAILRGCGDGRGKHRNGGGNEGSQGDHNVKRRTVLEVFCRLVPSKEFELLRRRIRGVL